jgi:hypothetical protein
MKDNIKATGKVKLVLTGPDGKVKQKVEVNNLVVEDGLEYITSRMKLTTPTIMSHMAVGTGTATPVSGNAVLGTEVLRSALTSTTVSGSQITYVAAFGVHAGSTTHALREAGVLNNATAGSGVLLCRTLYDQISKAPADTVTITWTVDLADT